jgi:hypothetical protein
MLETERFPNTEVHLRRRDLIAIVSLIALIPVAATGAQAPDAKPYTLVGTWSCVSAARSMGTWTFTTQDDGSIHMTNLFRTRTGVRGAFDEIYRFDGTTGHWNWNSSLKDDPGFSQDGAAPVWSPDSDRWVFDGTVRNEYLPPMESMRTPHFFKGATRMVYTLLDNDDMRRNIEVQRDGAWVTTNASTCKRAPVAS